MDLIEDTVDIDGTDGIERIDDVLRRLDTELVGLAQVKQRVKEIGALLVVDQLRTRYEQIGRAHV